jgi:hypothetical protein
LSRAGTLALALFEQWYIQQGSTRLEFHDMEESEWHWDTCVTHCWGIYLRPRFVVESRHQLSSWNASLAQTCVSLYLVSPLIHKRSERHFVRCLLLLTAILRVHFELTAKL